MKYVGMDVGSTTVKALVVDWRGAAEGEPSG
jgi:activator of 2-hydroxyglutaryl-CoA dehydratase